MTIIPFRVPPTASGFGVEDLRELARWDRGPYRVEIDRAPGCDLIGQFAMIYDGESPWASWAVGREDGQVLLWDCVTLETIGRFSSTRAALAAVPSAREESPWRPAAEVIPFRSATAGRSASTGSYLHG